MENSLITPSFDSTGITDLRIIAEMAAIKRSAMAAGTFMKASNGKPSRLNERQWLQVRTKSFKKWFGDWESAAFINMAAKVWDGSKVPARIHFVPSAKLQAKLQSVLGKDIRCLFVTDSDVRHTKKEHGQNEAQRGQADVTPEDFALLPLVMNEFDAATQTIVDHKGNKKMLFAKRINGTVYVACIERGESKAQALTMWKKSSRVVDAKSPTFTSETTPIDAAKVEQIVETAKFLCAAAKNSSKVVDENGEPMVVYHGTNANFTEFDKGKQNSNSKWGKGFYFTSSEKMGRDYANNPFSVEKPNAPMETFLDIRDEGDIKEHKTYTEFVAREPNQIKSATRNNGHFSQLNASMYDMPTVEKNAVQQQPVRRQQVQKVHRKKGFHL